MSKDYFSDEELKCKHCGELKFNPQTKIRLNALRTALGKPMIISSGYRCSEYNAEKGYTQTHATGQAVDISCSHQDAFNILRLAGEFGFTGIGISQKGSGRFIHLDDLAANNKRPRPHVWSY